MGLTAIRGRTFYWVSEVGMLVGTLIYVNLGTRLAELTSVRGLLSPALLASLVLLGLAPLIARSIVAQVKARRVYAGWKKPARFDRNLVVIGAGAAGLVSAYIAAAVKAKVSLIERHKMGGDCLNYGCVPSKALIKSAKMVAHARHAQHWGLAPHQFPVDFSQVMDRVAEVVRKIEPHDSVERYQGLGVECLMGEARIKSPWEVEVALQDDQGRPSGRTQVLSTRNIIIASGAQPFVPPIPGIESVGCLTSDTLWSLRERPARLLVLGGGPIGCELSQAFCRLGSGVIQVEMGPREGRRFLLADQADGRGATQRVEIEFDVLLCAVGRSARVSGFGLEDLKVPLARGGTIEVNEFLETNYPNILVAGDAAGPYQFTHTAAHMAWYAAVNALFGRFRKFRVEDRVLPWATFTEPEVARVGLNEQEARAKGIDHEVTRYGLDDLDRAIADGSEEGFIKVLTVPGKDRILGVTIVGEHAGDLIAEYVMAMKHGRGLNKILGTIHIYPTLAEADKYVAGEWKRAHAPRRLLDWVEKFHTWSRH